MVVEVLLFGLGARITAYPEFLRWLYAYHPRLKNTSRKT